MRVSRSWDPEALPHYRLGEDAEGESGLLRLFWTENSAVLIAGARDRVRAARREACKALHLLAAETTIGSHIWSDEHGARAALLANAASGAGQDEDVRWSAHSALSLIACAESCATQMWQHHPTRQVVVSTVRRAGRQSATRIRLEAWDTLTNSVSHGSAAVVQSLWLAETADDVRMAVMACLADDAEVEPIKLKAIAFLAAVVKKGGTEAIGRVWAEELARCSRVKGSRPPRCTCGARVRRQHRGERGARSSRRLKLLCAMCAQREPPKPDEQTDEAAEGAKEGASGAALGYEVMGVLLAAFEGERAVLDRQMREEIETEYERLEMARAAIGGEATSSQPLRLRSRYADLAVHERLARLRRVWERRGRGKGKMRVKVTIGSLVEDMLVLGQRLGDREDIDEMNPMHIRFDLDHGSDAGGLTRHCFAEFGKGLPLIEMVGATTEALTECVTC